MLLKRLLIYIKIMDIHIMMLILLRKMIDFATVKEAIFNCQSEN